MFIQKKKYQTLLACKEGVEVFKEMDQWLMRYVAFTFTRRQYI